MGQVLETLLATISWVLCILCFYMVSQKISFKMRLQLDQNPHWLKKVFEKTRDKTWQSTEGFRRGGVTKIFNVTRPMNFKRLFSGTPCMIVDCMYTYEIKPVRIRKPNHFPVSMIAIPLDSWVRSKDILLCKYYRKSRSRTSLWYWYCLVIFGLQNVKGMPGLSVEVLIFSEIVKWDKMAVQVPKLRTDLHSTLKCQVPDKYDLVVTNLF